MIIGINFTGISEDIPSLEAYRRALGFKPSLKLPGYRTRFSLKGITNNKEELKVMIQVADNGRRHIIFEESKKRKGWYALYIY